MAYLRQRTAYCILVICTPEAAYCILGICIPEAAYCILVHPLVWVCVVQQLDGGLYGDQRPAGHQLMQLTQQGEMKQLQLIRDHF